MNNKSALRKEIRSILNSLSSSEILSNSKTVCEQLLQTCPELSRASTIALFSAHGPEVRLSDLHSQLPDVRFVYPLCHPGGVLSFHEVSSPDSMTPGSHGILEPQNHTEVPLSDIDIIICPGIAFGKDRTRLGQGGGYYDRVMARKSESCLSIGVAFHCQVIESAPQHDHDVHMDRIVTERGLVN